jgi:hypothetical protein
MQNCTLRMATFAITLCEARIPREVIGAFLGLAPGNCDWDDMIPGPQK